MIRSDTSKGNKVKDDTVEQNKPNESKVGAVQQNEKKHGKANVFQGLAKFIRCVLFRLSALAIWVPFIFGPFDVGEKQLPCWSDWYMSHPWWAALSIVTITFVSFLFTSIATSIWLFGYIIVFPFVVIILILRYLWFLGKWAWKMLRMASTSYSFIASVAVMPIAYGGALFWSNHTLVMSCCIVLAAVTFVQLLYLMRLSKNPFMWTQPVIGLAKSIVDGLYGPKVFDGLLAKGPVIKEELEKKAKEAEVVRDVLVAFEKQLQQGKKFLLSWSVRIFIVVFIFSSVLVVLNYAAIYFALYRIDPGSWRVAGDFHVTGWATWISQSIAVFTTSSYLHSMPENATTMMFCVLETVCSISVITIFFLQFTYSSGQAIEQTLEDISDTVSSRRSQIAESTQTARKVIDADIIEEIGTPEDEADSKDGGDGEGDGDNASGEEGRGS